MILFRFDKLQRFEEEITGNAKIPGWDWSLNFTRYFYISNHAYCGEKTYWMRIGRRSESMKIFKFGKVR